MFVKYSIGRHNIVSPYCLTNIRVVHRPLHAAKKKKKNCINNFYLLLSKIRNFVNYFGVIRKGPLSKCRPIVDILRTVMMSYCSLVPGKALQEHGSRLYVGDVECEE